MPEVTRAASESRVRRSLLLVLGALLVVGPLAAATVPVRFAEGSIHGFFVLRTLEGRFLAQGDLLEVARNGEIEKTTLFRFQDGSLFQETVVFSQRGVYTLQHYRVEQRGPTFKEDIDLRLERASGKYRIEIRDHKDGATRVCEGTLELPPDLYNGMLPTVVKDLVRGAGETVHYVAFTPEPKIIQLAIAPEGRQTLKVGEGDRTAAHYVVRPVLGAWRRLFATVLGRVPHDGHVWILDGEVPSFVGFEGQLCNLGPAWRIDLVSPVRPLEPLQREGEIARKEAKR